MNADYVLRLQDITNCSQQEKNTLIHTCQTDLFWLCNHVLRSYRSKPLLPRVHGGICNSLVPKFPTPSSVELLGDTYTPPEVKEYEQWSPVKERVILSSRGTLKSTIEAADIVQLILCEPNIRIMILSGKLGLAKTILRMARGYFETNEVLGYLFPQWTQFIEINAEEFTSPARHGVNYRDPTVQIGTFGSVKAGVHVEYLALDDCTNEINQATPELVEGSIQDYDDLDPLLEPGGYRTFTGTRWAVDDLPEYVRQHGEDLEKTTGKKHVIYFSQPIWTLKTEEDPTLSPEDNQRILSDRAEREKSHKLKPEDVNLLWPEKINAEFLWPQYSKNYRAFACLPAGAPVLMQDWTEKSIEKIEVGDKVVGYTSKKIIPATVEAIHKEKSEVLKIMTSSGRILYCTPDHQWLRGKARQRYGMYQTLKLGSKIVSVYTPFPVKDTQNQRDLDWLGGMFDGEGTVNGSLFLSQSKIKNPEVWKGLDECLNRLDIVAKKYDHGKSGEKCMWHLSGGRSLRARLLQHSLMYKKERFINALWKQNSNVSEFKGIHDVISIKSVGEQEVYNIQTSSGNYVAYGYATKNCQYLLNPESAVSGMFTRQLLTRQTRSIAECPLPHRSTIVINWDLAGVSGKGDFACGVVGIWEETGRLYIVDAIVDKFRSSTDICNAIVRLYKKWNPDYHRIESANGSELLSGELKRIANSADLDRAFYPGWDPPSNKADAKHSRIMLLVGALERDELQFFSGIPCLDELFQQFEKFGKKAKGKKFNDDGPDCVAQLYEKWKGSIGPKAITYLSPSETVIDFQSELPKSDKNIDIHADERMNADIDFLQSFTVPFPGRG